MYLTYVDFGAESLLDPPKAARGRVGVVGWAVWVERLQSPAEVADGLVELLLAGDLLRQVELPPPPADGAARLEEPSFSIDG